MIELTIRGSIPSKKNSKKIICRGPYPLVLPSEAYEDWHDEQMILIAPTRPNEPVARCSITVRYFAPNRRTSDLDNKNSSICDLLKDAGYILDDNWNVVYQLNSEYCGVDKENPRAEIVIN